MYQIKKINSWLAFFVTFLTLNLLGLSASQAQLQPTTNVVVTDELNSDGNINVNAARLRRPTTDLLGKAHIGIFVMHSSPATRIFPSAMGWLSGVLRRYAPTAYGRVVRTNSMASNSMLQESEPE